MSNGAVEAHKCIANCKKIINSISNFSEQDATVNA